ncbi:MAG: hypothetical protein R6U13_11740 [Desulfatiglandaceae bacterium]
MPINDRRTIDEKTNVPAAAKFPQQNFRPMLGFFIRVEKTVRWRKDLLAGGRAIPPDIGRTGGVNATTETTLHESKETLETGDVGAKHDQHVSSCRWPGSRSSSQWFS